MKIVTASNGKKTITLSKTEWERIGKKAGWKNIKDSYEIDIIDIKDNFVKKELSKIVSNIDNYTLHVKYLSTGNKSHSNSPDDFEKIIIEDCYLKGDSNDIIDIKQDNNVIFLNIEDWIKDQLYGSVYEKGII